MKENQRITITKRMLKEGLLRLLQHKDLKNIRINELCQESGVNRATFYRHYETPQDVLLELERETALQVLPISQHPSSLAEVQSVIEKACTFFQDHADIMKILFRCNTEQDIERRIKDYYEQVIMLRAEDPQLAHLDNDTLKLYISLLGGGCYCLIRQWILDDMPKSPQEIAQIVCNVIRWPLFSLQ